MLPFKIVQTTKRKALSLGIHGKLTCKTTSMKKTNVYYLFVFAFFFSNVLKAQSFDNVKKEYTFFSLTEAMNEAKRTQRMALADYQPTGLNIPGSYSFAINVSAFDTVNYKARFLIGFKPLWGSRNKQHEGDLKVGRNSIYSKNEGLLFITFVKKTGFDANPASIKVTVDGGTPIPFYYHGQTSAKQFQQQFDSIQKADYVQFASSKVIVTIPYEDYARNPIKNLNNTFDTIHKVIDWENECAGFYGTSKEHSPTRLRMHYNVDTYKKNGDGYYMYATGYQIGMLRDNFTELTDPKLLAKGWGIWHETGHTNQQPSWRWGAIGEISVNIFSLYVQEKFEQPGPLNKPNSATQGMTLAENIQRYLALPDKDYNNHQKTDNNPLFTKMYMFWQLKEAYGWQLIQNIHRYFRENPSDGGTDQDKIDRFILASSTLSGNDLRPFFIKWGLKIGTETNTKIAALKLPLPKVDPSLNVTDKWKPTLKDTQKLAADFLAIENAEREKKGLKPFKSVPILVQQSKEHCNEMQVKGGFTWGEYPSRQNKIREELGIDSHPEFNMMSVENVTSAQEIWNAWLNDKKDGGGAFDKYDLVGVYILQDKNSNDKFYIAQYYAHDLEFIPAQQLAEKLFNAENEHRKKLGLKPFEIRQELVDAAAGLSKDMYDKKGMTYGDYGGRAKIIRDKLGNNVRVELHILVTGTGNVNEIMNAWTCPTDSPRRNIDGNYLYTGFGIIFDKGRYYIAQYFASDPTVK